MTQFKRFSLGSVMVIITTIVTGQTLCTPIQDKLSITKKISNINMNTFPWEDEVWDDADSWVDFIELATNKILKPSPRQKRALAFKLLQAADASNELNHDFIDTSTSWNDLDLFAGGRDAEKFVANQIDRTSTEIGKVMLYHLVSHTTNNDALLSSRQQLISFLFKNQDTLNKISTELNEYKKSENVILAFWGQACLKQATERNFFSQKGTQFLNKSETALLCNSLFGHWHRVLNFGCFTAASTLLTTYGLCLFLNLDNYEPLKTYVKKLENWTNEVKASPTPMIPLLWKLDQRYFRASLALIGGILCGLNIKKEWDWVYGGFLIEQKLQQLLIHISVCTKSLKRAYLLLKCSPQLANFPEFQGLINLFEKDIYQDSDLNELLNMLERDTFNGDPSWFAHRGVILKSYKLMLNVRHKLQDGICALGLLDAYASTAKLMQESHAKKCIYTFPKYIHADSPSIELENFWSPMLNPDSAVPNFLALGTKNNRPHAIITGPNEGGKSTILKAVAICLILAQSLGIAPAKNMGFTPFSSIATYRNITDDIGEGNSLFKAEVLRTQNLIDQIKNSGKNDFCFVLFDEVFNGTSPVEGSAAAFSVAKYLANFNNCICVISTHFDLLTKLESETEKYTNYMVRVIKQNDGTLYHPYTLERGASKEHVAIDILKNQGFSSEIIDNANQIVAQITSHPRQCLAHDVETFHIQSKD